MTRQEEEKAALAVSADTEVTPKAKPVQQPTQAKKNVTIDTEADTGDEAKASTLIDADAQQANKENAIDRLLKDRIEANKTEQQKLEADYQAQQKRQKRNAIISSIADGLSALSNMYFTSKGAPTPTRQAASMSEQQAKQNVADRNTYLELLQGWRKRNNELLGNYATYQATAERNRIANDNLKLSIDREARLYAKDEGERVYKEALLKYKQAKMDDETARWMAQIEQRKAELKARQEYWNRSLGIAQQRANNAAKGYTTEIRRTFVNGQPENEQIKKIPNNGNKQ